METVTGKYRWVKDDRHISVEWIGHGAMLEIPKEEFAQMLRDFNIVQIAVFQHKRGMSPDAEDLKPLMESDSQCASSS